MEPRESSESQLVELGRVVGAHALRGEVRVRYFGDDPDNLLGCDSVLLATRLDDPDARAFLVLKTGTGRGGEIRLALKGVSDRAGAEALRGLLVLVPADALAALPEDEHYWHELIGCEVVTETGEAVGVVREIWDSGRHDVLVIDAGEGRQVLVPTAREIMKRVDIAERRIVIDAIPGLLEA